MTTLAIGLLSASLLWEQISAEVDAGLEAAFKAAVARVAPAVVQIQTVGGLETLPTGAARGGPLLRGLGPTTGLIVAADGYIVSSSFNFVHLPAGITVHVPNGQTYPARLVARDRTRMLTLLKIEAHRLPVPAVTPKEEIHVGMWVAALGRTLSVSPQGPPSVSIGIVSATRRIWGKAVQTDAKVSPINYGGPLIDVYGRVVGILVPMSPRGDQETAGVEWYDSGIGFAVPLEDILRVLPKLKEGRNLGRGLLGIRWQAGHPLTAPPIVGDVLPGSAADRAGLRSGDRIVEIDGVPIERQAQAQLVLGPKYEGESVRLKIRRGEQTLELGPVALGADAPILRSAYLGILPMRDDATAGVEVRYVFADSPAAKAGLRPGDRIVTCNKLPVTDRNSLRSALDNLLPGTEIVLGVKRQGTEDKIEDIKLTTALAPLDDRVPDQLPVGTRKQAQAAGRSPAVPAALEKPRQPADKPVPAKQPQAKPQQPAKEVRKGAWEHHDPLSGHRFWVYVPENYDPNITYALVVWLHPPGDPMKDVILQVWRDLCQEHHLILLGPEADAPSGWVTSEADLIKSDIQYMLSQYAIDRFRVVTHGLGRGGDMALYLAFDAPELIAGAAAVGGTLDHLPAREPTRRPPRFYLVAGQRDPRLEGIRSLRPRLLERNVPVHWTEIAELGSGYIPQADGIRHLVRWIDSLDRL
ncbi:MAG: hypothetical protein C4296_03875 [Gemmataceae bacterium]